MYILECADGSYYTGSTWDLGRRLWEHQNGMGANHTAKRLPVQLVHCEEYDRVDDAFRREKQVQGWTHAKKKALIEQNEGKLHELARCANETLASAVGQPSLGSAPLTQRAEGVGFGSALRQGTGQAQPTGNTPFPEPHNAPFPERSRREREAKA
ncbi:MAG TPA: GIY-YIG nuclease family protein [Fibrobacteria bacterium]|nr:GIY-YIG nuclease family protein [Fibrobacteria bacterium]